MKRTIVLAWVLIAAAALCCCSRGVETASTSETASATPFATLPVEEDSIFRNDMMEAPTTLSDSQMMESTRQDDNDFDFSGFGSEIDSEAKRSEFTTVPRLTPSAETPPASSAAPTTKPTAVPTAASTTKPTAAPTVVPTAATTVAPTDFADDNDINYD